MFIALRLAGGLLALAIATLTIVEAPTNFLWMVKVAATEFGYFLVLPALLPHYPGWKRSWGARLAALMAVAGATLLLMPVIRAYTLAAELPAKIKQAFGEPGPRPEFADPLRSAPLVPFDLIFSVGSNPVRHNELTYREIDGEKLTVDMYEPSYPHGPIPAVIVVHGGGWSGGSSADLVPLNGYLAAREYVVFALNYRLVPRAPFPAALQDVYVLVDFIKKGAKELGIDPARIALIGRSEGHQSRPAKPMMLRLH
jgi:alpha/beta hydrolase fold